MKDELTKERIEKIELSADSGYSANDDDWAELIALAKIGIEARDAEPMDKELATAQAEVERLKGEAESWEQVFDRTCEHLAEAREQLTKAQKRSNRASIEFLVIWVTTILIAWLLAEMR